MNRRWLWVLIGAGILTQGALNMARPAISYKLLALGADAVMVGVANSVFALLPLIVALRLGRWTDQRHRMRPALVASVVMLTCGAALMALVDHLTGVLLGAVVLGLGHLVFTVSGQTAVARYSEPHALDLGFGWFTASYSMGQAFGPLAAGAIIGPGSVTEAGRIADVNATLWVAAATVALCLPLLFTPVFTTRSSPPVATGVDAVPARASIRSLLSRPGVASNMGASLTLLATMDILTAFLPLIGEEAGVSPVVIGWLLALRGLGAFLSRMLLPRLTTQFTRRTLLTACLVLSAASLAMQPLLMEQVWASGLLMFVGGFFLGLGQPLTMTLIVTGVPNTWRSQALAVRLMGNRLGQVGFPIIAGVAAAPLGPAGAIWTACAALLISASEMTVRKGR